MRDDRGVIAWFVRNPVAANMVMVMVVVGGLVSLWGTRQEVFPEIDTRTISVTVAYPGAAPEEVERGICVPVEEAVAGIEGIKQVRSTAMEAMGVVSLEIEDYANGRKVLNDVESAVDRITTFAEGIEDPVIAELTPRSRVLNVAIAGDVPRAMLKGLAESVRDGLTCLPGITIVNISGVRRPEIGIEVSEETLRRHGLSFTQVADAVRRGSEDLPGGSVKTPGGQVLLRTEGQRYSGESFSQVTVLTRPDGSVLRVGDVATVVDGFEDSDIDLYFDGKPAAVLSVMSVGDQDALQIADRVKEYVEDHKASMPPGVSMDVSFDDSLYLRGRIALLTEDTIAGAFLVFLCLALFMDLHVAFWVTVGIPTAFLGAFWLLPQFDVTINMISLFAFLIVLGIVVDDAIVIGENIYEHKQRGEDPMLATIRGVKEVSIPVILGVMTTVVAFLPLLFTSGQMGQIVRQIPLVAVSVLLISLIEGLLVFPSHMVRPRRIGTPGPIARVQGWFDAGLHRFIAGPYLRTLHKAVAARYLTVAVALAILLATAGFIGGGWIKFVFLEQMDADHISVQLAMPQGVPVEQTVEAVKRIEAAAERVRAKVDAGAPPGTPTIFRHISTTVGQQPFKAMVAGGGPGGAGMVLGADSHLAEINFELLPSEERPLSASLVESMLREEAGEVPGAASLVITSNFFSAGKSVEVHLSHKEWGTLLVAVEALKRRLGAYKGVIDVEDSFEHGKREAKLVGLTPGGEALSLRLTDVGRQVRQGFYGEEVQRFLRGRDEVKVMVRYPRDERTSVADLDNMRIRLDDGAEVPLPAVARWQMGTSHATLHRSDRRRDVSVTAEVDEAMNNATAVNADLTANVLPDLRREYPGLVTRFEGEQKEQSESLTSLMNNLMIAMLAIFALLAFQFRSYAQPLIVMSAIPFGLFGAVVGHVVMGLKLSFMSAFGMVALTGVVVNDSLLMIDTLNNLRARGVPLREAIFQSGTRRFRAILLNSSTTFMGLGPMVFERSLQARFLVPMAVSLAFGVMFATAVTLILVPVLYMILEDGKAAWERVRGRTNPSQATTTHGGGGLP